MMNSRNELVTLVVHYMPFVRDQHGEALVPEIPTGMWSGVRIIVK